MPKGAKKRAKLKKKQQEPGHPDDGGNNAHRHDGNGSGSDHSNASDRRDHTVRIPHRPPHVDASEDSMESSEETVTPRAAGSEADEEERRVARSAADEEERKDVADVPVETAAQVVEKGDATEGDAAGEEVTVDALPPETNGQTARQGKDDAEVEVHAVAHEPEVKDVVVDEAPVVQEPEVPEAPVVEVPEVKRETAKVHPVHEPEPKVDEVAVTGETPVPLAAHESDVKGGLVVVKDSSEVSRSREVDVHTTEAARGPAVAVAASGQRATWWNCCGLFDAFSGSGGLGDKKTRGDVLFKADG